MNNINKKEAGKIIIFGLMLAIRTAGYTIGWAAINSIILKRIGIESLPYSFILFASISMFGAFIYLFFADAVPRDKLIKIFSITTGIVFLISTIFISAYSKQNELTTELILFCTLIIFGEGIGYSLTSIQIWTLVNDAFSPSEGTKAYPLIAMAPSIGSIAGGFLIPLLVGSFGIRSLIIFWSLAVFSIIPLLDIFKKYYGDEIASRAGIIKKEGSTTFFQNFKEGFSFSINSPLIHIIAGICVMFWLVASLKEFQFDLILNQTFLNEKDLSKFYGNFTIILRTSVLIFQIFLTAKVIKFTGVAKGFYILPAVTFICLCSVIISFTFIPGLIMRFMWDFIGMTVQISVFQLSFNAVPYPMRGRVRGILEGFINPVGGILGGSVILLINRIFPTSHSLSDNKLITAISLFFCLLWIIIVFYTCKRYKNTILKNLESNDRRTCMDAIEMLSEVERPLAIEKLKEQFNKDDEDIKRAALKVSNTWGYNFKKELK